MKTMFYAIINLTLRFQSAGDIFQSEDKKLSFPHPMLLARLFLQESSIHGPSNHDRTSSSILSNFQSWPSTMLLKGPSDFQKSRPSCKKILGVDSPRRQESYIYRVTGTENIDTDIDRHTRDVWSSEYCVFHSDFKKVCPGLILVMKST